MSVIYRFSYDSPVRYLPLVYLLPYDLISRFPTLRKLPRSMGALNASPEWGEVILSQQKSRTPWPRWCSPTSASAAGRSITPAIPRCGACPTPCSCGPRAWSVCGAGACRPCSICRPTSRYRSLTRTMLRR